MGQIRHYQREIKNLRKQLQDSYNVDRLVEIENDIKAKKARVKELGDEGLALKRVQAEQQLALQSINREGEYEEKIAEMAHELRHCKKQYREIYYAQIENDKLLIERHDALRRLDGRVRKMQRQLKHHVEGKRPKSPVEEEDVVTAGLLQRLQQEIEQQRQARAQGEKELRFQLVEQEQELEQLEHDVKVMELQVREKEQEGRLAELKLKELKRTVRHRSLKPLVSPKAQAKLLPNGTSALKYQSIDTSSKVLRKKLENGRITYQDVVLTEENVKLHEKKYLQQTQRYSSQPDMSMQSPTYPAYRASNEVNQTTNFDQRSPIEKLKGPQKIATPRMNQLQLLNLESNKQAELANQ